MIFTFHDCTMELGYVSKQPHDTVDGWNPANQLRLVVFPIIYRVSYIPGGSGFQPSTVCLKMKCKEANLFDVCSIAFFFQKWNPPMESFLLDQLIPSHTLPLFENSSFWDTKKLPLLNLWNQDTPKKQNTTGVVQRWLVGWLVGWLC